jgi:hypothetical protein
MKREKQPIARKPTPIMRTIAAYGPLNSTVVTGEITPTSANSARIGRRPKRSDNAGTMIDDSAPAIPRAPSATLIDSGDIPRV